LSNGRRVAIIQSSYIPWRGYFLIMKACDIFIVLDSVQFTRRDWRSRNRIRTSQGPAWLTIPLRQRGQYLSPIDQMVVADGSWSERHLGQIRAAYNEVPFGPSVLDALTDLYREAAAMPLLTDINLHFMSWICDRLQIRTPVVRDIDLLTRSDLSRLGATDRLLALTRAVGGTTYLSGPSARGYLEVAGFLRENVEVEWVDYGGLQPYPQHGGGYEHHLSTLDAILNIGFEGTRKSLLAASVAACRATSE
jgi:hypothetical protein